MLENSQKILKFQTPVFFYIPSNILYFSGGERITLDIAKELAKKYNVKIVNNSSILPKKNTFIKNITQLEIKYGVDIESGEFKQYSRFLDIFYHELPVFDDIRVLNRGINIILAWRLPPISYLKKVIDLKNPVVFALHGVSIQNSIPFKPMIVLYQLYIHIYSRLISKYFKHNNLYFLVLTEYSERFMRKIGINKDKVFRIPNGINFSNCMVRNNPTRFTVLFAGRISESDKGIRRLVRIVNSFSKFDEIDFIVIGRGPDERLLKKINNPRYRFFGYVSESEKINFFANANLFILTSNMEPYSISVLESLSSGLPVISTSVPGPLEILSNIPDSGRIAGFSRKSFFTMIMEYYRQWKSDKDEYYLRKIARSDNASKFYSDANMYEKYFKMMEMLKSYLTE